MHNITKLFTKYGSGLICLCSITMSWAASTPDVQLQAILPLYENAILHPWHSIPTTDSLKIGSQDKAVLLVREHLKITQDLPADKDTNSELFDEPLADAVKSFQWRHGLLADGVVGAKTRATLNIAPEVWVKQIQLDIQRWAKLLNTTDTRYLLVNIPEYQLHLIDNHQEVLTMKVIVGKPQRPTPELVSTITRIALNPYWNVPETIARKDILPKILHNPDYLRDMKIKVYSKTENNTQEINQNSINWQEENRNGLKYHFRQDPGTDNSLGLVKFEFQNTHSVYLHDTPAKALFAKDQRDLSSGCIRLEKPFDLVTYLTQGDERLTQENIKNLLDAVENRHFTLKNPLPIFITYITTWVDDKGVIHFGEDIYNLNG